jgi:hypothetical protein
LEATLNVSSELIVVKKKGENITLPNAAEIKVINCEHSTAPEKRNLGYKNSNAIYVHFLDDDDYIHKDFYRILLNKIHENNNYLGVACSVNLVNIHGIKIRVNIKKQGTYGYKDILTANKIGTTSSVILKNEFLQKDPFTKGLTVRQDYELWLRLLNQNKDKYIYVTNEILMDYTMGSVNSISTKTKINKHIFGAIRIIYLEKRFLKDYLKLILGTIRYILSKLLK